MRISSPKLSRALIPFFALILAAVLPAATVSAAPTPEEVVGRCVDHMMQVTQHTVEAIRTTASEGVHKIETLDADNKPPRVMIRVAKGTAKKIEKRAKKSARLINRTADKCLRILVRLEADPSFGALINEARGRSLEAIRTAADAGLAAVRTAIEAALADEEPPAVSSGGALPASPAGI